MRCVKSVGVCFLAIMITLLFSPSSGPWCAEKVSRPLEYSGYTSPEYTGYERAAEYVAMKDGTRLATVRYVPAGGPSDGPFPVIFTYYPYHYEITNPETGVTQPHFIQEAVDFYTSHGYVLILADMRGSGASYGVRAELSEQLAEDGKELVDWIAEQPWSDGNVGMIGVSYMGWSQYATAGRKPAALKCIMPGYFGFDEFTRISEYPGGIRHKGGMFALWRTQYFDKNVYWPDFPAVALATPATPMIDEDNDGELADEIPLDLDGDGSFLEDYHLPGNPPQYRDGNERQHIYYLMTLEHVKSTQKVDEPLWFRDRPVLTGSDVIFEKLSVNDYPTRIAESGIPVYNTGGWFDEYVNGTTQWYSTLAKTNPSKLIIGPFLHNWAGIIPSSEFGPYVDYYGESHDKLKQAFRLESLRFLDFYLKDIKNGISTEPPVYIYVMNGEGWRAENEWPLARQVMTGFHFDEANSLATERLSQGSDNYQVDLTHDARQDSSQASRWGGRIDSVRLRTEDAQCLTYTMKEPLENDVEVTGHPIVHLWVSSTADYGDFFVYLEDVDEDGKAYYVTDGQLRAGFAKLVPNEDILAGESPLDVLPDIPWHGYKESDYVDGIFAGGNIVELVFDMFPTSWVFKKGHRIRVSIAGADTPTFVLHPKLSPTNDPEDTNNIAPTITVYRDAEHPSRIELPVIPSEPVEKVSEPFKYSGYTFQEYTGYERAAQYVPMRDGTRLATVWYTPKGGPSDGPFPVIFTYFPYHYDLTNPVTGKTYPHYNQEAVDFYTSYGYAMAVADMRGSGASYGTRINFSEQLAEDGKELVDWIAAQPWCDGNVGMMGISYLGWSQYATAGRKPDALKCIIPGCIGFDEYMRGGQYPGGIRQKGGTFRIWGPTFFDKNVYWPDSGIAALATPASPIIDEDNDGELADEIPLDLDGDGSFLEDYQLPGNPPQYSDGNERQHIYYLMTLEHMANPYLIDNTLGFRDGQVIAESQDTFEDLTPNDYPIRIAETDIAICNTGGWFDRFARGTTLWYATLEKTNPSRMIIGPNNHSMPGALAVSSGPYWEYFGENMSKVAMGYNLERLRFLDFHLKGVQNGIDAEEPVHIYVMNGEGWRAENEWPLARQKMTDYYFYEGNSLSVEKSPEGSDDYQADFTHDARQDSSSAGRWGGILDSVLMRTEKDLQCLTYTMKQPLDKDTEVTGHPVVHLWVSSTADYGDFFVYLEDVDENGNAYYVTDGQLRAGFAKLVPNEDMLPQGSALDVLPDIPWHGYKESDYVDGIFAEGNITELVFDLWPTSWVFKKGHSIRVSIACADWPTFMLHPELSPANDPADTGNIIPRITVHRSGTYLSRIELPVIPGSDTEYEQGDADGNGKIDIYDALAVAMYDVRLKKQDDIPGFAVADVDGNGKVDIFDALMIAEYVAGLIPGFDEKGYTTHILTRGADLSGTVSLNFSPDGEMFVIDAFSSRLLKMNPENGQILDVFTEGIEPADLDFAPDGTMYWMNPFSGQVWKKTTDGKVSMIAELPPLIDGVSVNAEGRVFTASFVVGQDALWELDPDGILPPRLVVELGGFDAFDFGPDGYLYAPDYLNGTGQIYKIDVDTGEVAVVTDGFCQPISTKFNSLGELHVIDYTCPKVVKVDIATGEKTLVANLHPGADNFDFSPEDELFIAFNADAYIGKVLPDGTVHEVTKPGLASPGAISVRPDGSLFVADVFAMRRYDAETATLEKTFYTNTGMIPPFTLYDDGRYIILTCHLFGGVQIWDPDADESVELYMDFSQPTNAIRFRGDIIVAELGTGSVVTTDHMPLIQGLSVPAGLAARGDDLYVGDMGTGIIWKAVESGERLDPPLAVAEGLASPEGIAFDNEGRLLVVEVGKRRLVRIDPESGSLLVVADDLEVGLKAPLMTAPTWVAMSSVAVSESGVLYVTGDVGNVIYRIEEN